MNKGSLIRTPLSITAYWHPSVIGTYEDGSRQLVSKMAMQCCDSGELICIASALMSGDAELFAAACDVKMRHGDR